MSNRIPTNIFGGALIQGGSQGLTLPQADQRYLNVSADKMQGTLDMNNQPIKNLRTPEGSHGIHNKSLCGWSHTKHTRKI